MKVKYVGECGMMKYEGELPTSDVGAQMSYPPHGGKVVEALEGQPTPTLDYNEVSWVANIVG